MNTTVLRFRPPRIAFGLLAFATAIHLLVVLGPFELLSSLVVGTAIFAAGLLVMLGAWWQFRRNNVAICPTADTERLVTAGLYRYSRNPMYLGMVLMMAGIALAMGSAPYYAAAVIQALILNRHFCPCEERKLRERFGDAYNAYASRVRRWI